MMCQWSNFLASWSCSHYIFIYCLCSILPKIFYMYVRSVLSIPKGG